MSYKYGEHLAPNIDHAQGELPFSVPRCNKWSCSSPSLGPLGNRLAGSQEQEHQGLSHFTWNNY